LALRILACGGCASCGSDRIDLFAAVLVEAGPFDAPVEIAPFEASSGCTTDSDCKIGAAHRCEPALHVCVNCVGDSDCANRNDSRCNLYKNECVLPCAANTDCLGLDVCDVSHMWCADCVMNDAQCSTSRPHCVDETCVCQTSAECGVGKVCWQGACVSCGTTADCPAGKVCMANHDCE
jgi:hypothetical protein